MSEKKTEPVPALQRVNKSRAKAKEKGAKLFPLWLTAETSEALEAEAARTGESKTAVINRLLLSIR